MSFKGFIAGMLVPVAAIGVIAAVPKFSKPVSNWIAKTFSEDYKNTVSAKEALEKQLEVTNAELTKAKADLATANADLVTANASITAKIARIAELEAQIETLNATVATKQASIEKLTADLAEANADLAEAQADLETANETIETKEARIAELTTQLENAQSELAEAQADLTSANAELEEANADIIAKQTQITNLQNQIDSLNSQVTTLTNEKQALQTQLNSRVEIAGTETVALTHNQSTMQDVTVESEHVSMWNVYASLQVGDINSMPVGTYDYSTYYYNAIEEALYKVDFQLNIERLNEQLFSGTYVWESTEEECASNGWTLGYKITMTINDDLTELSVIAHDYNAEEQTWFDETATYPIVYENGIYEFDSGESVLNPFTALNETTIVLGTSAQNDGRLFVKVETEAVDEYAEFYGEFSVSNASGSFESGQTLNINSNNIVISDLTSVTFTKTYSVMPDNLALAFNYNEHLFIITKSNNDLIMQEFLGGTSTATGTFVGQVTLIEA